MVKKSAVALVGVLMVLSSTAPVFADAPTPSASIVIARANQTIQVAKKVEQSEESSYQILLLQAKSTLTTVSTLSGTSVSTKARQVTSNLQTDLSAISSAKTMSQLQVAANALVRDAEKLKNSLNNNGEQHGNEQRNSLKNILADSQQSLSNFVRDVQQQVSIVQSLTNALGGTASKQEIKQLMKATGKLNKAIEKMDSKFKKWDGKIKQHLSALQEVTKGTVSGGQTPTPPALPSGANSTTTALTPPTPPAPPSNP